MGEIKDGEAFIHEFTVPDKLAKLQFTLKARVENLAAGNKQDLTDQGTFALNQIDKTLKLENVHLARLDGGYVLDVLGKNGEAKPERAVSVQLKHRDFKSALSVSLKSNPAGRVRLAGDVEVMRAGQPARGGDRAEHAAAAQLQAEAEARLRRRGAAPPPPNRRLLLAGPRGHSFFR